MLTSEEIHSLSHEQQALLFLLFQEGGVDTNCLPITAQTNDRSSYPLSFSQRRLWILNQLEPANPAYNMFGALHLSSSVNAQELELCFKEIIKRHDVLRAAFRIENNNPVMVIDSTDNFQLKRIDLSHLNLDSSNPVVHQLILEEQAIVFDLQLGSLLKATLIKLTDVEFLLLFTMHHIISDAWSLNILIQELEYFHQMINVGNAAALPTLRIQYPDYSVWQQEIVAKSPAFIKSIDYWLHQLQGGEHILNLPMDGVRLPLQTSRGGKLAFTLPCELTHKIKALSLIEDVSLFMFLLTAFQVLLFRYSNQNDFLIGSVISNRSRHELESLIGLFSNTLILRANLADDPTFQGLLKKTKQVVLDAFAHQDVPFEIIVEKLNVKRDLSYHPLFQVMFVYEHESKNFNISGTSAKKLDVTNGFSKFDLTLFIENNNEEQLTGYIEYNADLFKPETINSYIESYIALLEEMVTLPQKKVSKMSLISFQQAQAVLSWTDDSGPAKNKCLHQHFEKWVELTPNEIALSYQGADVSYEELNQRSNQIAHRLIQMGIKKGQPVAMMLEIGVDQIASLLAINKVGGIFICLDKQYPTIRLKQILQEVMPVCVISDLISLNVHCQNFLSSQQEAHYDMFILNLSDDSATVNKATLFSNPNLTISPTDPVYIVYTSGSTGKPKGIVQTHGGSSQYMEWQSNQFNIQSKTRMAQWASITYDASYSEIFGALCFGATLCIAAPLDRRDPQAMAQWIELEKINVIQLVPSFCTLLLQRFIARGCAPLYLEYVLLAGERLPIELAREFQAYFNHKTKLYNLYGPSEIVLTTQYLINELPPALTSIPIGAPFVGRQILILDKNDSLCPLRIPGEIYIKSPYLTLGYFQQPEETSKVYIQNPLHNDYPDRVYKTGDRARWLNANEIEFLGRNDNQVKIRGSRVEPGEIEAVLLLHDLVSESAVIIKQHQDDTPYLIAFVCGAENIDIQSIREFLMDYLPSYMIPAHIVCLLDFPRTISGKIDRKMLANQWHLNQNTSDDTAIPENECEKMIAEVWKELLHLHSVRNDVNFFELGGHSLLMVQAQLKLNERFKKSLALVDLFKYPTIKLLANFLLHQKEDDGLKQGNQRALLRKRLHQNRRN